MNIEATKLELMQLLLQTEKESLLNKLKKVFEEEHADWWSDMSEDEQAAVKNGLMEADKENYVSKKEVLNLFDKWH